jgi:hypothetical protein
VSPEDVPGAAQQDEASRAAAIFDLSGRTAIVTGASSGLGERFAEVLAANGATVFAVARRADRLAALAGRHPGIRALAADLGAPGEGQRLFSVATAQSGRIDILVNNAGVGGEQHFADATIESIRDVFDVNVVAAMELCQLMGAQPQPEGTSIINVGSILGMVAGAPLGGASYAASKGALLALTRELAAQWGRRGIRVNSLAPGWFRTEMTAALFADEGASRYVDRNTLLGRTGDVCELDGALLLLASRAGSYLTGHTLVVDGGWTAR